MRRLARACACCAIAVTLLGCGYRPIRSGLEGHPAIRVVHVAAGSPAGAELDVAADAEVGARGELSRWGALAGEGGDAGDVDELRVEVVRIDERSEGETVIDGPAAPSSKPLARGIRVRVTARGEVAGHGASFVTSDAEASELVATPPDAVSWEGARAAATHTAARRAGAAVAREALGIP